MKVHNEPCEDCESEYRDQAQALGGALNEQVAANEALSELVRLYRDLYAYQAAHIANLQHELDHALGKEHGHGR